MKAKEKHRTNILEYLANPDHDIPTRENLATAIGIRKVTLYENFTPAELTEMESEGLEMRRQRYAPQISKVDKAMLKRAAEGDPNAAKLAYQRFEGWSEKQRLDVKHGLDAEVAEMTDDEVQKHLQRFGVSPAIEGDPGDSGDDNNEGEPQ